MSPQRAEPVERHALPSEEALVERLTTALRRSSAGGHVELVGRERVGHRATFPNEIVSVTVDGQLRRIFCKYQEGPGHPVFGHRRGVAYETEVYRKVLVPLGADAVGYLGDDVDPQSGDTWLFLEYVEEAEPYAWRPSLRNLCAAVDWLGRFHSAGEELLARRRLPFLTRYDRAYYVGWAERTLAFTEPLRDRHPWVEAACAGFGELVDVLLEAPPAVIHGEYYAKNVLLEGGAVYAIDWESAAVAPGEIDLASASDGRWGPGVVERGEASYAAARWPNGAPADFERRLALARLYTQLRWLGDRPEWTLGSKLQWRFQSAETAARGLGLL